MKSSIIDFMIDATSINIRDTLIAIRGALIASRDALIAIEGFNREALINREDSLFADLDNNCN